MSEAPITTIRERKLGLWLWLGFVFLYLLTARATWYAGDDLFYLSIARNWVKHGAPLFGFTDQDLEISKYSIGQVMVNVPIAGPLDTIMTEGTPWGKYLLAMLMMGLWHAMLGACQVVLLWRVGRRLEWSTGVALLTAICFGAGTMLWPGTQRAYGDQTLSLLLLVTVWGLLRFREHGRWRDLVLAGLGSGFGLLVKPTSIVTALVFSLAVVAQLLLAERRDWRGMFKRWRELTAWGVPHVVFGSGVLIYNYWRYHSITATGYGSDFSGAYGFSTPLLVGVHSLLAASGKGVLWYNPVLILGFWGLASFWRHWRTGLLIAIGCLLGALGVHARFWAWHGDWYWGPRYLMPVLPLLMLPVGYALQRLSQVQLPAKRRLLGALAGLALVVSVGVQLLGTLVVSNEYFQYMGRLAPVVFNEQNWRSSTGPVLDPDLLIHYVPSFSPLSVHPWMINVLLHADGDWQTVFRQPPWRYLSDLWVVEPPPEQPFSWQPWWLFTLTQPVPKLAWPMLLLAFNVLAVVCCAAMLWRLGRRGSTALASDA